MDYGNLFKQARYQELLDLTKDKIDIDSLSYRLNALIALNRYLEALKIIKKYNNILFEKNPLKTMELHLELLLELKMYVEAIDMHREYSERPYISQQVEEFLKEIPNKIIRAQKSQEAHDLFLNEDKVKEIFVKSKDSVLLTNAIYHLKKMDIIPYIPSILTLLERKDVSDDVKTLALLILIMKHVDIDITLIKYNKEYKVNPIKLTAPYLQIKYKEIMQIIINISKDPTIESVATNLFNQYVLNVFPGEIYNAKSQTMAVAFVALAKRYLKEEISVNEVITSNDEKVEEVIKLMNLYQSEIERK